MLRFFTQRIGSKTAAKSRRPLALRVQPLEDRLLMAADIRWTNEGSAANDQDGFNAEFGDANADIARANVKAAIADWAKVIDNFNYEGVGTSFHAPVANTFFLEVHATGSVANEGLDLGTAGITEIRDVGADGKPWRATIRLDDDAFGRGWAFDTTPNDHLEFTNVLTSFAASAPISAATLVGGPGVVFNGNLDFRDTVLHEIGHAVGIELAEIRLRLDDFVTDAGWDQHPLAIGQGLRLLSLDDVQATFTTEGGGHLYEAAPDPEFPDVPSHPLDLMSDGRAMYDRPASDTIGFSTAPILRRLISDLDVSILSDVYGYSVKLPSAQGPTFFAGLSTVTNVLTVVGDPAMPADGQIVLERNGNVLNVAVNGMKQSFSTVGITAINVIGNRQTLVLSEQNSTAGRTYNITPTALSSSSFSALISYTNLKGMILRTGTGSDTIYAGPDPNFSLLIEAGFGNDTIVVSSGKTTVNAGFDHDTISVLGGKVTVEGNVGSDTLNVHLEPRAAFGFVEKVYTINAGLIKATGGGHVEYFGIDEVHLSPLEDGAYRYNVESTDTSPGVTLHTSLTATKNEVRLAAGNYGFETIRRAITIDGRASADAVNFADELTIEDHFGTSGQTYLVGASGAGSRLIRGDQTVVYFSGLDRMILNGTPFDDTLTIESHAGSAALQFNAGTANDSDQLIGPNRLNTWNVGPTTYWKLNGNIEFRNVEILTGGSQSDHFIFAAGAQVQGRVAGAGGVDTLDYAAYVTPVIVDLGLNYAMNIGVYGGDNGSLPGNNPLSILAMSLLPITNVTGIENVIGGISNDRLTGNALGNVLRGGPGSDTLIGAEGVDLLLGEGDNDTLDGGAGRDFLIGGLGADKLFGGSDDDLLIGGRTSYDTNERGLSRIMMQWTRKDLDYAARVDAIFRTIPEKLNTTSVLDDATVDELCGGDGLDWFIASVLYKTGDKLIGRLNAEILGFAGL